MKEPKFRCHLCDFGSVSKQYVINHTETVHEGKKPFECDICQTKFITQHKLNVHMSAAHEEENQFKCDICEDTFESKGKLKGHIFLVHDKKKSSRINHKKRSEKEEEKREFKSNFFNCEACDSSFALEQHLESHISSVHDGKKPT